MAPPRGANASRQSGAEGTNLMEPAPNKLCAKSTADGLFSRHFPRVAGAMVMLLGCLVMIGWLAHWTAIIQMLPQLPPMKFNTALSFVFCGAGLILMTTRQAGIAPWLGGIAGMIGLLTLLEYLSGQNLAIDQWIVRDYVLTATTFAGRMSPLAASCFLSIGLAMAAASLKSQRKWRLTMTGLLASMVAMIAFVALFGYAFGIEAAYGWGAYTRMAAHTATGYLILGSGLLAWAWQTARRENVDFLRWLPVAASVTLMAMIAVVAVASFQQLKNTADWRKHTVQVILAAQSFQDNFTSIARGMRGYVTLGDANALASYQSSRALEPKQFDQLVQLTRNDPAQQRRLKDLAAAVQASLAYDDRMIALYRQQGVEAVFKVDVTGEGRIILGHERDAMKLFSQDEQRLWDVGDATEQANYHNTTHLLVFGSVLAATLLLFANWIASRELIFRRRAEAKLEKQAAELKRSNEELEQFAYVASHDMREPLRAVSGFAQILKRTHGDKLDGKAGEMIGHIVDGAKRMSDMIDDLLALSHLGAQGKPFERTALEKPLSVALENLSVVMRERSAIVRHDALPTLPVDASQLALLFQNLIGNAIKFCRDRRPEIHIGAARGADGFWTLSARDNGIGIEPKHFDRIFVIFQRLHTREQYPGTGIGLAMCKKIVERHGGRIWPESKVGEGTTFYFTLPERQKYEGKPTPD